jgi:hypothetical protein
MENANKTALSHLQQEQTQKDEENKQLKEKLAKLEAELNRVTDNDLNYDSPDDENDNDDNNNINYDTECSDEEQDTKHSTRKYVSIEEYADPNYGSLDDDDYNDNGDNNTTDYYTECSDEEEEEEGANYDSSDNEDRTNDIYLD